MIILALVLGAISLALFTLHVWERYQAIIREDAWRLERTALLQRIQAPEIAIVEQAKQPERKPVRVVGYDDDADFHDAKRALNGNSD